MRNRSIWPENDAAPDFGAMQVPNDKRLIAMEMDGRSGAVRPREKHKTTGRTEDLQAVFARASGSRSQLKNCEESFLLADS